MRTDPCSFAITLWMIYYQNRHFLFKYVQTGCDRSELAHLSDDDDIWDKLSYYLAQLCSTLVLIASPQQIILGGGVMNRASLYPRIRFHLKKILNGYICSPSLTDEGLEKFIGKFLHVKYIVCLFVSRVYL